MPMLDSFLKSDLVVCAQSGNVEEIHNHFPEFTSSIYEFCTRHPDYEFKYLTLIALEHFIQLLACGYEDICSSCHKRLMKVVDYIVFARNEILKENHNGQNTTSVHLKWYGSRTQLCEKIYGEYVMCLTGTESNKQATIGNIIDAFNKLYGMDITEDECNDALRKMKERKGKGYPDYKDNIQVRAYHSYNTHRALEDYMINQETIKDGRKQTGPKPKV